MIRFRFLSSCALAVLTLAAGCGKKETSASTAASTAPTPTPVAAAPAAPTAAAKLAVPVAPPTAVIETDLGTIEFELLGSAAPKATANFLLLAERGYYNGVTFHRIVKGFMIQGGDPQGNGRGGESAWGGFFADEIVKDSPLYLKGAGYKRGIVAMANMGPNTNGSQFFILHQDHPLPPSYTIFGRVIKGQEVVDLLAELPTERGPDGGLSKPKVAPVMKKVSIRK